MENDRKERKEIEVKITKRKMRYRKKYVKEKVRIKGEKFVKCDV